MEKYFIYKNRREFFEEGYYDAIIKNIEIKKEIGKLVKIIVMFQLTDGREHNQVYYASINDGSHFGRLVKSLLGEVGNKFDPECLINIKCNIEIRHNISNETTYCNVVNAKRLDENTNNTKKFIKKMDDNLFKEEE